MNLSLEIISFDPNPRIVAIFHEPPPPVFLKMSQKSVWDQFFNFISEMLHIYRLLTQTVLAADKLWVVESIAHTPRA